MIRFWVEDKTSMDGRPFDLDKHDKAISDKWLDKIKQAREEIEHLDGTTDDYNRNGEVIFRNMVDVDEVLEILDRLISEVEE